MSLFRKSTIFHVEDTLPDPEDLKLRFRRRILLVAVAGFLLVLGAPVARELRPHLNARAEARRFAEQMLAARTLAGTTRAPVGFSIGSDRQNWTELFFVPGESCAAEAPAPRMPVTTEAGFSWKLQAQQENGEAISGHLLCWHPEKGLFLDSVPLAEGKLLVSLSATSEEGQEQELASLLVTQAGGEIQTISY